MINKNRICSSPLKARSERNHIQKMSRNQLKVTPTIWNSVFKYNFGISGIIQFWTPIQFWNFYGISSGSFKTRMQKPLLESLYKTQLILNGKTEFSFTLVRWSNSLKCIFFNFNYLLINIYNEWWKLWQKYKIGNLKNQVLLHVFTTKVY